jgi:tRNA pseudouridine32 synthase / 23S rRNA pseudouridine746 synthase
MYAIVFEHDDFLVISKHRGICVHSEPDEIGLMVQLTQDLGVGTIFPVHRLDKVTSGLLLCAKTQAAASELSQLFQRRQVEKYYLAISDQKPKKKQGLIIGDMVRSRRSSWKLCPTKHNPAITQFFSYSLGSGKRLFLLKPKTGKTHQLRVALKSIGSPIIGDRLYGHSLDGLSGIYLHAFSLSFSYQGNDYRYVDLPHWHLGDLEGEPLLAQSKNVLEADALDLLLASISKPWELPWPTV